MKCLMRKLVWLSLAVFLSGCAESALIKSYPAGSKAYIDDKYVGSTPVWAPFPRSEVRPGHKWRVEYRNCDPVEGELTTGVGAGRIVGYIFTLGISAAFIGPINGNFPVATNGTRINAMKG